MNPSETNGWFKRKKFGYGWALFSTWQGWLLSVTYLVLLALGWRVAGEESATAFTVYALLLTTSALGVCSWKGEPSLWRGKQSRERVGTK